MINKFTKICPTCQTQLEVYYEDCIKCGGYITYECFDCGYIIDENGEEI